ncbi:MAG: hypothetical protein IPH88_07705 [Bacteroidales bacterium]|nr:hypothetical protein [Bacteroidales bacterium]
MKRILLFLVALAISSMSFAALTGVKTIPGDYATIAAAIADLNAQGVGSGGVTFNVAAGHTETLALPTDGLITATGTLADPIVFQKSGAGLNPVVTAAVGASATVDGIIVIAGGDYITFDGIDLTESAANLTATTQMEWGYALVKGNVAAPYNGSEFVTIKNCSITLNKANTASVGIYSGNHVAANTTGLTILATTDASNNCKFFNNSIQNVYAGIKLNGFSAATPFALYDQNNEVGVGGANTISNFGGAASTAYGIYATNQNGLKILNNNITGGTGTTTTLYGIFASAGTSSNVDINYNIVTIVGSGTTSQVAAIANSIGSTALSNTVNINNNTVQNCQYNTATSGVFYAILNSASATTVNINNNVITGNTLSGTGAWYGIETSSPVTANVVGNNINTNSRTGIGIMYGIKTTSPTNLFVTNNTVDGFAQNATASTGAIYGFYSLSSAVNVNVTGNVFKNFTSTGASSIYGIREYGISGTKTFQNNQAYNFSCVGGSFYGVYCSTGNITMSGNSVYAMNATGGTAGAAYGLYISGGTTNSMYSNSVYNLSLASAGPTLYGIYIGGGTTNNVYNNFVSDLRTPAANAAIPLVGIYISGGTTTYCDFNSVYLNATSSGAIFGSAGIYTSTTPAITMRNNNIVNVSTPNTTGYTAAHRRSGAATTALGAATGFNNYYVGSGTNKVIYYDGTTSYATVAAYKAALSPKESGSIEENAPFVNVSTAPYDLHLNTSIATLLESGGTTVAGITTDFDGNTRNVSTPDIGADEGTFTAFSLVPPASFAAAPWSSTENRITFLPTGTPLNNAVIVWSTTNTFTNPTNGTPPPAVGQPFGGGTLLYNGQSSPQLHSGLTAGTTYYYSAWSVDGSNNYSVATTGAATPAVAAPSNLVATTFSATQINLTWTLNAAGHNVMVASNSASATFGTPVNGTALNVGDPISGGGTVIYNGPLSGFNNTGLIAGTTYNYKAWSVDAANYYSATGITANATTMFGVPYSQNFNASTSLPAGWGGTFFIASPHGTAASNGLYRNLYSSVTTASAISPSVVLSANLCRLIFDYRIVDYTGYPATATVLGASDKIDVDVSTDGGVTYTTIYSINSTTHVTSTAFANKVFSLTGYNSQTVKVRFNAVWGIGDYYVDIDNFILEEIPVNPSITLLPTSLDCGYAASGAYSAEKTYTIAGENLSGAPGNILVSAPANFEVSLTTGAGFGPSVNVAYATSTLAATTVYVRCAPTATNVYYTGNVTNVGGGASGNVAVAGNSDIFAGYCTSMASNTADEEIYSVTVNGATNAYDCATVAPGPGSILQRYSNFFTLGSLTTMQRTGTYSFTVLENECDGSTYYSNGCAIWIDFNQDGDFLDAGEQVYTEAATSISPRTITGNITIPSGATLGVTAMRITVAEGYVGAGLTPCLAYGYGETEDYKITIDVAPACPTPSLLTATASAYNQAVLGWDAAGTTAWEIEYGPAGFTQGTGTMITAGITNPYTLTGLSAVTSYDYYVRANCGSGIFSSWAGPKNFVTPPTCPAPTALFTTGVLTTSAKLGWTENGTATAWDIELGLFGFTPSGTPTASGVVDNPYTYGGLTQSTTYSFYVRSYCSVSDQSTWVGPFSFTTECDVFAAPFIQNFNATTKPNCWTISGPQNWLFTNTWADYGADLVTDHSGTGGSFAGVDGSGSASLTGITLTTPMIDISALTTERLRFYLFNNNINDASYQTLTVNMWDGAAWIPAIYTWGPTMNNAAWQEIIVDLTAYAVTGPIQFQFVVDKGAGSPFYDDMIIDDVYVENVPTCQNPSLLSATNITTTSADLFWNANGTTAWEIEYGPFGFTQGTGTMITTGVTNPYTLGGLSAATSYSYYVRAYCAPDYSFWIGPYTFSTLCTALTLPYAQNFDAVTAPAIPNCMLVSNENGDTQLWKTSASYNRSAPNSMYISYNASAAMDDWFYTPGFTLAPGQYKVSFWYRASGSYPEKLEVKWGTSQSAAAMTLGTIYDNPSINNSAFAEGTGTFTVTSAGTYYLGWHGYSDADMWYLVVDDISISEVVAHDVAVTSVDMGSLLTPEATTPKATVVNNGSNTETFNVTMTIGSYTDVQTVTALAPGASVQVSFANWTPAVGTYTAQACTNLGSDLVPANDCKTKSISIEVLTKFYAYNAYDPTGSVPQGPGYFYKEHPEIFVSLAPTTSVEFIGAGTWANDVWYGSEYYDSTIPDGGGWYKIDANNGSMTKIADLAKGFTGITYDHINSVMYGIEWDGATNILYTIVPATGAYTLVGSVAPGELLINLATDETGMLYALGSTTDHLFKINPAGLVLTDIGATGVSMNYAQDMEYDYNSNTMYAAAYTTLGQLYTVNLTSGAMTLVNGFQGGAELCGLAIPYTYNPSKTLSVTALFEGLAADRGVGAPPAGTMFQAYDELGPHFAAGIR